MNCNCDRLHRRHLSVHNEHINNLARELHLWSFHGFSDPASVAQLQLRCPNVAASRCWHVYELAEDFGQLSAPLPGRFVERTGSGSTFSTQGWGSGRAPCFFVWWCGVCGGLLVRRFLPHNAHTKQRTKHKLSLIRLQFLRQAILPQMADNCPIFFGLNPSRPITF